MKPLRSRRTLHTLAQQDRTREFSTSNLVYVLDGAALQRRGNCSTLGSALATEENSRLTTNGKSTASAVSSRALIELANLLRGTVEITLIGTIGINP